MILTAENTRELSRLFRRLSKRLKRYRREHRRELSEGDRKVLQDLELELLNDASDMITAAVGLELEETEGSFEALRASLNNANEAIGQLKTTKKVVSVAANVVGLAGALVARNGGDIVNSVKAIYDVLTGST
jgi:hypothetical protein